MVANLIEVNMKVVFTIGAVVIASGFAACGGTAHHNAASVGTSQANGAAAPTAPVPTVPAPTTSAPTTPTPTAPAPALDESISQAPTGEFEIKVQILKNAGRDAAAEKSWGTVRTAGLPYFAVQSGFLPAVATDGSALALLFNETHGAADVPISTLVVIDKRGNIQSVSLSGHKLDSFGADPLTAKAANALQKQRDLATKTANARIVELLGKRTWRAANQAKAIHLNELAPDIANAVSPEYKPYQTPDDRDTAASFVRLGDTLLAFEPNSYKFTRHSVNDKPFSKPVALTFPAYGVNEVTKAQCGNAYAIGTAYWHETFPYALVFPETKLADSCIENEDPMARGLLIKR